MISVLGEEMFTIFLFLTCNDSKKLKNTNSHLNFNKFTPTWYETGTQIHQPFKHTEDTVLFGLHCISHEPSWLWPANGAVLRKEAICLPTFWG